jgi:hypothetical protein
VPSVESVDDRLKPSFALEIRQIIYPSIVPLRSRLVVSTPHRQTRKGTVSVHQRVETTRARLRSAGSCNVIERPAVEEKPEVGSSMPHNLTSDLVDGAAVLGGGEGTGGVDEEGFEQVRDVVLPALCEFCLLALVDQFDCGCRR